MSDEIYRSANGDRWLLIRERNVVRHEPNLTAAPGYAGTGLAAPLEAVVVCGWWGPCQEVKAASTPSCEVPNVDAILPNNGMPLKIRACMCRLDGMLRKLIDLAVIGIEDRATCPFILGHRRQSPDDRLPALGGALCVLHPDNSAAD